MRSPTSEPTTTSTGQILVYPLSRPGRMSLASLALRTGVHPELLRRFVALGLLEVTTGPNGELWFALTAPSSVARIQRLRVGLSLNYAAVGVVIDLLDRIQELETRAGTARRSEPPWT